MTGRTEGFPFAVTDITITRNRHNQIDTMSCPSGSACCDAPKAGHGVARRRSSYVDPDVQAKVVEAPPLSEASAASGAAVPHHVAASRRSSFSGQHYVEEPVSLPAAPMPWKKLLVPQDPNPESETTLPEGTSPIGSAAPVPKSLPE